MNSGYPKEPKRVKHWVVGSWRVAASGEISCLAAANQSQLNWKGLVAPLGATYLIAQGVSPGYNGGTAS